MYVTFSYLALTKGRRCIGMCITDDLSKLSLGDSALTVSTVVGFLAYTLQDPGLLHSEGWTLFCALGLFDIKMTVHPAFPYALARFQTIQVVDTGLDETSCFFADDTGGEVEHGYLFDGIEVDATTGYPSAALGKPWFPYDMSRRKVRFRVKARIF